jgi:hypothetical protein
MEKQEGDPRRAKVEKEFDASNFEFKEDTPEENSLI